MNYRDDSRATARGAASRQLPSQCQHYQRQTSKSACHAAEAALPCPAAHRNPQQRTAVVYATRCVPKSNFIGDKDAGGGGEGLTTSALAVPTYERHTCGLYLCTTGKGGK